MNKLYGMYIVESEGSIMRMLAASNEVGKLKDVIFTPSHAFYVASEIERESRKIITHTKDGVYPYYAIYEIPYIV